MLIGGMEGGLGMGRQVWAQDACTDDGIARSLCVYVRLDMCNVVWKSVFEWLQPDESRSVP